MPSIFDLVPRDSCLLFDKSDFYVRLIKKEDKSPWKRGSSIPARRNQKNNIGVLDVGCSPSRQKPSQSQQHNSVISDFQQVFAGCSDVTCLVLNRLGKRDKNAQRQNNLFHSDAKMFQLQPQLLLVPTQEGRQKNWERGWLVLLKNIKLQLFLSKIAKNYLVTLLHVTK